MILKLVNLKKGQDMRKELKKLGTEIAQYPEQCFITNIGIQKEMRLGHLWKARNKKTIFKNDLLKAERDLKALKTEKQLVRLLCP